MSGGNLLFTLDGTKRSDVVPWDVTLVAAGQVPSAPPVWVSGNSNKNVHFIIQYTVDKISTGSQLLRFSKENRNSLTSF